MAMQDSVFSVIHRRRPLNDVVDDDWIEDCLSDDGRPPQTPSCPVGMVLPAP